MHQARRAHYLAAESFADTLMAQADAQHRHRPGEFAQDRNGDAGFGRSARTGRNHDRVGLQRASAGDIDRVVALDDNFDTEFTEVLHQVVGKRIVVVDHQELHEG